MVGLEKTQISVQEPNHSCSLISVPATIVIMSQRPPGEASASSDALGCVGVTPLLTPPNFD
eukprot:974318-Amphidinium_carterae.1